MKEKTLYQRWRRKHCTKEAREYQGQSESLKKGQGRKEKDLFETSGKLAEWCRFYQKSLNTLGFPKKRVASAPQSERLEKTLEPLLPKERGIEPVT